MSDNFKINVNLKSLDVKLPLVLESREDEIHCRTAGKNVEELYVRITDTIKQKNSEHLALVATAFDFSFSLLKEQVEKEEVSKQVDELNSLIKDLLDK